MTTAAMLGGMATEELRGMATEECAWNGGWDADI